MSLLPAAETADQDPVEEIMPADAQSGCQNKAVRCDARPQISGELLAEAWWFV